jgi:serine phosphatase RsbU (regulator of sigma subunit)
LNNNQFGLVIADSTGHGVPGAIMSILNIACLDKAVTKGINRPDLILNETRNLIKEYLTDDDSSEGTKDGMDGNLLSFDFENNKLYSASAINPIWIIRNGSIIEIKADRFPIGSHIKDKTPFTLHEQDIVKGDVIYSFTDGFPDQFGGPNGKKFKYKQLQELLLSISDDSMENQKLKLNDVFTSWKGDFEQIDDVCLIGIRI